jgi:hypothetical protein
VTDELIETVARAITAEVRKAEEKVEGRSSFTVDECWEQYKPEARAVLKAIEANGYTLTRTVSADNYTKGKDTSPPLLSGTVRDDNGGIWNLTVDLRPWKEGSQ